MSKKTVREFTEVTCLKELYTKHAKIIGDKIIFRYFSKEGSLDTVTYSQFKSRIERLSAGLDVLGLCGKRVAVIGETSPEWIETYLAVISTGGVIIPLDKELLVDEIANFLNVSEADAIVFSRSFNKKVENFSKNADTVRYYIAMDTDGYDFPEDKNVLDISEVVFRGQRKLAEKGYTLPENTDREKMSCMLFTSGTTGTSKCVMLSEKNLTSCINSCCSTVDFYPNDVLMSVLPLHHTYEMACTLSEINYGMEICINDSLKKLMKNFAIFKPTAIVLVPLFVTTIYKRIWDEAKKKGKEEVLRRGIAVSNATRAVGLDIRKNLFREVIDSFGGRLNKIVCGGAPMDAEMVKNFAAFGISVVEGYGITECSPLIAVSPYYKQKAGSVGPSVPSCSVVIDSPTEDEEGRLVGEILVKGDNVMIGYYKNPEANAEAFTEDGYFRTGDIGYKDKDGYIFITGRKKNVIVLNNGKNVFPEEIEEYLYKTDTIKECVVVGRKNEASGDIVLTALIYPAFEKFENADITAVAEQIKNSVLETNKLLPGFKQIRNVEIKTTEFEKTSTRKIKRFLIK